MIAKATQVPNLQELSAAANSAHAHVTESMRNMVLYAKEAGDALRQAKAALPHGEWTDWLRENFNGTEQTARTYMRIARHWTEYIEQELDNRANMSIREVIQHLNNITRPRTNRNNILEIPDLLKDSDRHVSLRNREETDTETVLSSISHLKSVLGKALIEQLHSQDIADIADTMYDFQIRKQELESGGYRVIFLLMYRTEDFDDSYAEGSQTGWQELHDFKRRVVDETSFHDKEERAKREVRQKVARALNRGRKSA